MSVTSTKRLMSFLRVSTTFSSQRLCQTAIWSKLYFVLKTRPNTSSAPVNYSPIIAKSKSSQYFEVWVFGTFSVKRPPSLKAGSSQRGCTPATKKCKSVPIGITYGLRRCPWTYQKEPICKLHETWFILQYQTPQQSSWQRCIHRQVKVDFADFWLWPKLRTCFVI